MQRSGNLVIGTSGDQENPTPLKHRGKEGAEELRLAVPEHHYSFALDGMPYSEIRQPEKSADSE